MRSAREIAVRLRQEAVNVALLLRPPLWKGTPDSFSLPPFSLPHGSVVAAALRGTAFEREILRIAAEIRAHRFTLLGTTIDTGADIRWRRDAVNGKETGTDYFRLIPYLDAARAGDHKTIWELNRHQHLIVLAQAWLFNGEAANLAEIFAQLESWEDANPFQRGINWASALEVAFRALSWLWIYHFAGREMPAGLRGRFLESLYRHAKHVENNLSFYFSPNTHLLGEAVVLHALGSLFPEFSELGAQVAAEQMQKQVRDDGSHFEQSTYYHVYALDMFLFHAIVAGEVSAAYRSKLERMAEYLHAILGPQQRLPFIGDDDGGRFFHPYGARDRFGRGTMATCGVYFQRAEWIGCREDCVEQAAWWLGAPALKVEPRAAVYESRLFRDAGMAVMTAGDRHALLDAGPFGPWGSGHSHSDTLSLTVRRADEDILIDPGTYTYVGGETWRNWFRGSGAHNTIRIDGADQAVPVGPFRWTGQPTVVVHAWESTAEHDFLDSECSYRGFTHRRRVRFTKPDRIDITDEISGPAGEHKIEQFWHLGSEEAARRIVFDGVAEEVEGWRSDAFGEKHASPALRVRRRCELPVRLEARIEL